MRITPHAHCLRLEFGIETPAGERIPRFATSHIIEGETLALIDTGVASTTADVFAYVESIGRGPEEIAHVIHTHSHFDHVGGNGLIAERARPKFRASEAERKMIEDLDHQHRVRPVGKMREAVSGPVRVEGVLSEGDEISPGGVAVRVIHTPGHSAGSLSFFLPGDGVLICGDVLPEPGALPIYESAAATLRSLEKLKTVEGARVLLSAMSRRVSRDEAVPAHLESGADYLREIGGLVQEAWARSGGELSPEEAAAFVFGRLNLPRSGMIPIVLRSFAAHLEEGPMEASPPFQTARSLYRGPASVFGEF